MLCGHDGYRKEDYSDIFFPPPRNKCNWCNYINRKKKKGKNRPINVLMLTYHVLYIIITAGINSLLQEDFLINVIYKWQFMAHKTWRYFRPPSFICELILKWAISVRDRFLLINFISLFSFCWIVSNICQVSGNLEWKLVIFQFK